WVGLLAGAALMVDVGVIGEQTLGRRAVNLACPQARGRLNGLYTGLFFVGGGIGSALAGVAWAAAGWTLVCVVGLGFVTLALALASIERADDDADAGGTDDARIVVGASIKEISP